MKEIAAYLILILIYLFVAGPAIFGNSSMKYWEAVASSLLFAAFLVAVVAIILAAAWAISVLAGAQ